MSRSVWKGPFLPASLLAKVFKIKSGNSAVRTIKTRKRNCTIIPDFIGLTFLVYNGKRYLPVAVNDQMVGHKLGEFSPTRNFRGHKKKDSK